MANGPSVALRRGRDPSGYTATCEPTITVRAFGSPKCSIGLFALRAIMMNRRLRQRFIPGVSVGVIVMRDMKEACSRSRLRSSRR